MSYHQIHANINLPTTPNLLKMVLSAEKLSAIYQLIGTEELSRIAAVPHDGQVSDFKAASEQEGRDLEVLRKAITQVTGKSRPWIIGFASEFASGLLVACQTQAK